MKIFVVLFQNWFRIGSEMKPNSKLNELQVASMLKKGVNFSVPSERERKMVLTAAKYLGQDVMTRLADDRTSFNVFFVEAK